MRTHRAPTPPTPTPRALGGAHRAGDVLVGLALLVRFVLDPMGEGPIPRR